MKRILLAGCAVFALAGCAGTQEQQLQSVLALQTTYNAGVTAEIVYEKSGKSDPAILAKIEADRIQAYAALTPLVQAAESGSSVITAAEMEAATVAITTLQSFETANAVHP